MAEVTPPLIPLADRNTQPVRQSYAQRRLWFLYQMAPDIAQHNLMLRLTLAGQPLCRERLSSVLAKIVQRHSVFRTCYRSTTEHQEQWVTPCDKVALKYQDITKLAPQIQVETLTRISSDEQKTVFDLCNGRVMQALLATLAADRQELFITVHHIAFDGRSITLFMRELAQLYAAETSDPLPPVALQYRDFAAWEPHYLTAVRIDAEIAFWRDYLLDTPMLMEFDRHPRHEGSLQAARYHFFMPATTVDGVRAAAKSHCQTLFTTLVGLFGVCMQHLSGRNRFLIGTDVHGRDVPELADIMGFFVNQLAIKCDFSNGELDKRESDIDPTFGTLLERAHTHAVAALAHRALPFDVLVSALAPPRQAERMPLFQVKLNYQRYQFPVDRIGETRITQTQIVQDMTGLDLVLDLTHGSAGIDACLEYDEQRFSKPEIERFASLWLTLFEQCELLREKPFSHIREQMQRWEDSLLNEQQQAHHLNNRAQLLATARKTRTPQTFTLQENT